MPPAKRIPHDDPKWTERKAAIRQMKFDGKTQAQMRQKLEEDGFSVTKAELEAQLKFWGLRARMPKNKSNVVWQYTDYHLSRRERAGKRSVVYHDGKLVGSARLEKERKRHQPSSLAKYTTVSSPKTPEGVLISICSPAATPMQLQWPQNLPWLRFQDGAEHILSSSHQTIKSKPPQQQSQNRFDLYLASLHWQYNGVSTETFSEFAASLASMMPGSDEDEIVNRAQLIMHGTATQAFGEYLKIIFYGLSNNIYTLGRVTSSPHAEERRLSLIVNLIERSGMTDQALDLMSIDDLTIASVAENLFQLCAKFKFWGCEIEESIQASNTKIITWLLKSGQSPDTMLDVGYEISVLENAMYSYDFQLAVQLLDAGADPNFCGGRHDSPLLLLLQDREEKFSQLTRQEQKTFQTLVRRLLEAGASIHEEPPHRQCHKPSALMLAAMLDSQIADILIQHKASIQYQLNDDHWLGELQSEFCRTRSVLGFAACNESEEQAIKNVQHLLDQARRLDPPIFAADLISADVLCNAASRGFNKLIALCRDSSAVVTRDELFPALCAASFYGHRRTCELLLQYGAPVNGPGGLEGIPCPIHLAALSDSCGVAELLCQHGANVNAEFSFKEYDRKHNLWSRVIENPVLQGLVANKLRGDKIQRKIQTPCAFVNSLGAAMFGAGEKIPSTFPVLLRHGARLPCWTVYYGACGRPDPWLIQLAVEEGANLNWHPLGGKTPLQTALAALSPPIPDRSYKSLSNRKDDCLNVVESLVDAGAETAGNDPQIAVLLGRQDFFDKAMPQGLDHNAQRTTYQISTLSAALLTRSSSTIQRVLSQMPAAYDHGALCTSVMLAISFDMTYPLQQLLNNHEQQADCSQSEGLGLGLAAWYERVDILNMLLSKVQSSALALLPVHVMPRYTYEVEHPPRKEEIEKIISDSLEEKIPFWHREPEFGTDLVQGSPLILALWSNNCLDKLIKSNCYPDRLTMSTAVCSCNINILEKLVHLPRLDNGHLDRPGPLFLSVEDGDAHKMRLMLEAGENPNEDNHLVRYGRSPLQKAVENGDLEAMDVLLKHGANVNAPAATVRGATALQLAAIKGRIGVAQQLLNLGADVNAPGAVEGGRTALEGAAEHGRLDMVQLLLDRGAMLTGRRGLQYFRAIDLARENNHLVVADALEHYREWTNLDFDLMDAVLQLNFLRFSELTAEDGTEQSLYGVDDDGLQENRSFGGSQEHSMDVINAGNYDVTLGKQWDSNDGLGTAWNQHHESMDRKSKDLHRATPVISSHPEHDDTTAKELEAHAFGAKTPWNQQYQTAHWFQSRSFVAAEMGSGTYYEVPEGDLNFLEAQHDESYAFGMDWFRSQSSVAVQRETGLCYEILEGDMDWLETQDDGSQMFDMDWSQ